MIADGRRRRRRVDVVVDGSIVCFAFAIVCVRRVMFV